jgi:HEAT repeat protein
MGSLDDDKAVPTLEAWAAPGKELRTRMAAIRSLALLKKDDKQLTQQIASYLNESHFRVKMAAVFALGARGDASAIPALEALLKSKDLSIEMAPMIRRQIARLKKGGEQQSKEASGAEESGESEQSAIETRLEHLETLAREMNERLKAIEERLPPKK